LNRRFVSTNQNPHASRNPNPHAISLPLL
jgi:hypothetical protein